MSPDGQDGGLRDEDGSALEVCTFPMPAGTVFDGVTEVSDDDGARGGRPGVGPRSQDQAWSCPRRVPCGSPRACATRRSRRARPRMRSAYLHPSMCSVTWSARTPVVATVLLGELLGGTWAATTSPPRAGATPSGSSSTLLEPVESVSFDVRRPVEERARRVADGLALDPADDRTLAEWGREVGERADPGALLLYPWTRPALRALVHDAAPARRDAGIGQGRARLQRCPHRGLRVGRARSSRPSGERRGLPPCGVLPLPGRGSDSYVDDADRATRFEHPGSTARSRCARGARSPASNRADACPLPAPRPAICALTGRRRGARS